MRLERRQIGYVLTVLSTIALAAVSIMSKLAYRTVSREMHLVIMYSSATIASGIYLLVNRDTDKMRLSRQQWLSVTLVGMLYFVGSTAFFYGILITGPALVNFFGRIQTVYIVLWSALFYHERMNKGEVWGMMITLIGALIITFASGEQVWLAFLIALFGESLFNSLGFMATKLTVERKVAPSVTVLYRNAMIVGLNVAVTAARGRLELPPIDGLLLSLGAGVLGPFLTRLLLIGALVYLDASQVAIMRNLQPVFVVLLSLLILGTLPAAHQMVGGALAIVGAFVVLRARSKASEAKGP